MRFKSDWFTAEKDKKTFSMWENGEITTAEAKLKIEENNEAIMYEPFEAYANSLGYFRGGKQKYD